MPQIDLTKDNIEDKERIPKVESGTVDYADKKLKGFYLRVGKDSKTFFVRLM